MVTDTLRLFQGSGEPSAGVDVDSGATVPETKAESVRHLPSDGRDPVQSGRLGRHGLGQHNLAGVCR